MLDKLGELGLTEKTVILFTSDNGGLSTLQGKRVAPGCSLPLRGGKGWMYEGGVRVPLIVKWPGVTRPGATCSVPVVSTDFYPTLLEIAGLPAKPEQHLDGVSLTGLLRGEKKLARDAIYWHFPHYHGSGNRPTAGMRKGDFKLVRWYESGSEELYRLSGRPRRTDRSRRHDARQAQGDGGRTRCLAETDRCEDGETEPR